MLITLELKNSPGRERREKAVLGKAKSRKKGREIRKSRYIREIIV